MTIKGKIRNEWVEALLSGTLDKEAIPDEIVMQLKEKYKKFENKSGMSDYVVKSKSLQKAQGATEEE